MKEDRREAGINPFDLLSERQQDILVFTYQFLKEKEIPPTIREICQGTGIRSTSVVNYNLEKIADLGILIRSQKKARGIRFTGLFREKIEPEIIELITPEDFDKEQSR